MAVHQQTLNELKLQFYRYRSLLQECQAYLQTGFEDEEVELVYCDRLQQRIKDELDGSQGDVCR